MGFEIPVLLLLFVVSCCYNYSSGPAVMRVTKLDRLCASLVFDALLVYAVVTERRDSFTFKFQPLKSKSKFSRTRIMRRHVALVLAIAVMVRKTTSEEGVSANLALHGKTGESSSLNSDTKGRNAVNGRVDEVERAQHFVSALAKDDHDPYWYVELDDMYLVQTVEIISRRDCCVDRMHTSEVRVGESLNDDGGTTNPLCGEPKNMNNIPKHTFRCELYGKFVTVKKANSPVITVLVLLEVMVNKEPTLNVALKRPTYHSSISGQDTNSDYAVDGTLCYYRFHTAGDGALPHWLMIDFEERRKVHKIFVLPKKVYLEHFKKVIMTLGNDLTDNGKHNAKIGDVHDFSKRKYSGSIVYVLPRKHGRYFYFESQLPQALSIWEIEIYEETQPFITLRTDESGSRSRIFYEGHVAVLTCPAMGYPRPRIVWVKDGVVVQNKTTHTLLKWTVNVTKGSSSKYECYATNIHGKDYYPITVTIAGRYDMCMKPEEIRDPTRNILSKEDPSVAPKSDAATFDQNKMYTFFNPQSSLYMKLVTSCPPPSSCGTGTPGWLSGDHPKLEDGMLRKKVCIHYNGDCCYKALYISVINCPGMFVYALENSAFDFPMRYCFENDKNYEAFAPFRSVPLLFGAVGGSNTALVNHVVAKDHGIEDTSQCLIVCMMNKCRSFNFDKLEKICEVNNVTRDEYPRDLSAKPGFQYYHPMKQPIVVNKDHN